MQRPFPNEKSDRSSSAAVKRGRWPKATALFWCQNAHLVLSQFCSVKMSGWGKGVGLYSESLIYYGAAFFWAKAAPVSRHLTTRVLGFRGSWDDVMTGENSNTRINRHMTVTPERTCVRWGVAVA
jgi:hypothetical protein